MLGKILETLDGEDLSILALIEGLRKKFEYAPVEVIESKSRIPPGRLLRILNKLRSLKLVTIKIGGFTGYSLTFRGLDVLAVDALKAKGVIVRLGERIGVGKEGEVYLSKGREDLLIVKLNRGGIKSFRKLKRYRGYVVDMPTDWIEYAKLIGEREFKIMSKLYESGARVPKPIAWNRHAVVQEYIEGVELYKVKNLDRETALEIFNGILETLKIAYRIGVVHGDLSEYNILFTYNGDAYVIDWPQYVYIEDPRAGILLKRDLKYILRFFERRFNITRDLDEVLEFVKGGISEGPQS